MKPSDITDPGARAAYERKLREAYEACNGDDEEEAAATAKTLIWAATLVFVAAVIGLLLAHHTSSHRRERNWHPAPVSSAQPSTPPATGGRP